MDEQDDDAYYRELLAEEWDDPSAVDNRAIKEQLEIDKTNFSPFVVSGVPGEIRPDEDNISEEEDLQLLAIEMERAMEGLNIDDSDSSEDSVASMEVDQIDQIDPVDLSNHYNCCIHRCLLKLPADDLRKYVVDVRKLKESEKRQLLHPLIACCVKSDTVESTRKRRKRHEDLDNSNYVADVGVEAAPDRNRVAYEYKVMGKVLCKISFCFLFCIGHTMLDNIQKDINRGQIFATQSRRGLHRLGFQSNNTTSVLLYLDWYAREYGYPCPCGRGSKRDKPVIYLPAGLMKKDVYQSYFDTVSDLNTTPMLYKSFCNVWFTKANTIRIRLPKTDICDTCCALRTLRDYETMATHLSRAKLQRSSYNDSINLSKLWLEQGHPNRCVQLTFDYAERVLLPLFKDTPKSIFYKVGRKMDLFGIGNNTTSVQHNYVLPEGSWPGDKTINSLCSMIYERIVDEHSQKEIIKFMADNCAGQNKNKYMLWWMAYMSFALYSTLPSLQCMQLKFLVAGHTKNFCDACFGLCKRSIKGQEVFTPKQLVAKYEGSATCNKVVTASKVVWYDWKEFLSQFFSGTVARMNSFYEFEFYNEKPGYVKYKEFYDSPTWSEINLLKEGVNPNNVAFPTGDFKPLDKFIVEPETYLLSNKIITKKHGPDMTREQYLREQVTSHWFIGDKEPLKEDYFGNGD